MGARQNDGGCQRRLGGASSDALVGGGLTEPRTTRLLSVALSSPVVIDAEREGNECLGWST
jgi:hypothetical protein